ncbi:MAG TPA: hypothetical protein VEF72_23855 [Mycobacterium sp.]|nr:hypothetical protein [Mycobacterium sp.]
MSSKTRPHSALHILNFGCQSSAPEIRARAAQAEAEAKAAEAARLHDRAASHRSEVEASRAQLDEQFAHADRIDPLVRTEKTRPGEARGEETRPGETRGAENRPTGE